LVCFLSLIVTFYGGLIIGWHTRGVGIQGGHSLSSFRSSSSSSSEKKAASEISISNLNDLLKQTTDASDQQASQIAELRKREQVLEQQLLQQQQQQQQDSKSKSNHGTDIDIDIDNSNPASTLTLPYHADVFDDHHTRKFASGMEFVDRNEFAELFDTGVPLDETTAGNDKVLLLYSDPKAFPSTNSKGPLSTEEATSNCHNLHIVLTQSDRKEQCIAIMGQYESFHIQKYMRVDGPKGKIDPNLPLQYTTRGHQQNGRISAKIPDIESTKEHWKSLVSYLQSLETVLKDLGPILEKVASHNANNAIIVMVCNFGQSELLLNFICNARAKGLESVLSNVLLFATDQVTHDLAQLMGITSVYIESVFGGMPENAARTYADRTFRHMMIAKVYCIQMVSMLGYDILFQDVDVIWYKNPLTWFHNETNPHYGFDMYFQDDGNHALFYAPYSANTGFYYVRNNERTQYFFNSFLMVGEQILSSGSHQIPLITHLSEHASLHGLRVKTWERNMKEFPGGFTFHSNKHKNFIKDLISGGELARDTYILHMSWTNSKINKVKFFQQMGEWYLEDTCGNRSPSEITGKSAEDCCAVAPIVSCYFRDKPSKIPCQDSPPIDKGRPSWW